MTAVSLTQQQYQQFIDSTFGLEARVATLQTHAEAQQEQIRVPGGVNRMHVSLLAVNDVEQHRPIVLAHCDLLIIPTSALTENTQQIVSRRLFATRNNQ